MKIISAILLVVHFLCAGSFVANRGRQSVNVTRLFGALSHDPTIPRRSSIGNVKLTCARRGSWLGGARSRAALDLLAGRQQDER